MDKLEAIAKKVGVSWLSVSMLIDDHNAPHLSPRVIWAIWEAKRELGC